MAGPAVVIAGSGIPVKPVDGGAPVVTVASSGVPIVISDNGAPFVVEGYEPPEPEPEE